MDRGSQKGRKPLQKVNEIRCLPDLRGSLGHFVAISRIDRAVTLAGALACALVLGGCGAVAFEGKIFDYMGVSGDRQQTDVHMSERPPLMVPPSLNTLPQPGTNAAVATARQDWPDDPERARKRAVSYTHLRAHETRHDLVCRLLLEK